MNLGQQHTDWSVSFFTLPLSFLSPHLTEWRHRATDHQGNISLGLEKRRECLQFPGRWNVSCKEQEEWEDHMMTVYNNCACLKLINYSWEDNMICSIFWKPMMSLMFYQIPYKKNIISSQVIKYAHISAQLKTLCCFSLPRLLCCLWLWDHIFVIISGHGHACELLINA